MRYLLKGKGTFAFLQTMITYLSLKTLMNRQKPLSCKIKLIKVRMIDPFIK